MLVCVSAGDGCGRAGARAKRLATCCDAPWTAVHVETAATAPPTRPSRDRVAETLKLAEQLGGGPWS